MRYLASEALGGLDPESDLVHVRSAWAAAKKVPSGYYQSIPGNLVMFVLISTLTYGAGLLAQERKKGLLRRLASSPMRVAEIISGKLLGRAATASIQSGVFLVLGLFVFRIDWGRSPAGLLLVVASLVLCAAGLGLLSGCLFASGEAASGLGIVFSLVMSALGGCWWPAEVMPAWLRAAGLAFPTTWAMRGLHEVLSWGGGIREVLLPSAILLLYAAGAAGLAASRFRASAR